MFNSVFSAFTEVISQVCNLSAKRSSRRRFHSTNTQAVQRTESLEVKSYPTATLAASVVGATAGPTSVVNETDDETTFVPVVGSQAQSSRATAYVGEGSRSSTMATRRILSVVTILNASTQNMVYALQWPGQSVQTFELRPGESKVHAAADPRQQNLAPMIVFDGSAAFGFQQSVDVLHSKFYVQSSDEYCTFDRGGRAVTTGWTTPSTQDGMAHVYQANASRTGFAMQMHNPMYTSRRTDVRRFVQGVSGNYEVLGSFTNGSSFGAAGTYNCIAWTVGNVGRWVWGSEWSNGSAASMDSMYRSLGYSKTPAGNTGLQLGFQKVAVYATVGARGRISITHGALQMSDGTWTSKMGQTPLVRHETANSVAGNFYDQKGYGVVVAVYVRPTNYGWSGLAGSSRSTSMTATLQNATRALTLSVARSLPASQSSRSGSQTVWASQAKNTRISSIVRSEFETTVRELQQKNKPMAAPATKAVPVPVSVVSSESETFAIDALMSDAGGFLGSLLA